VVKKIIIPLSSIIALYAALSILGTIPDLSENAKEGDLDGMTENMTELVVKETEHKVTEPLWRILISNPLTWVIGAVGTIFGVKIIFK
jgi:hypothetical protein